jgi:ferredoxin--NADP+ reductase
MFTIREKTNLAHDVYRVVLNAPLVARKTRPGQFVILRVTPRGERIPLSVVDSDPEKGTISVVFHKMGKSTMVLGSLSEGDSLPDVVGPLGIPSHIEKLGLVVCIGGGLGIAPIYPVARAFREAGSRVVSILGARTGDLLILREEMKTASSEIRMCTEDGTYGQRGVVTDLLEQLIEEGNPIDLVLAVGPAEMMEAACKVTRPHAIRTVVSLNPIMVDGTGMCGSCRVTVDGETRFACVDGPDFDGHKVDFAELKLRQNMYLEEELQAVQAMVNSNE